MKNQKGKNHPSYTHGLSKHPLYKAFAKAYQRCTNPNDPRHHLCKGRWGKNSPAELTLHYLEEYEEFVKKYPGKTPTIDRIDEDGKYEIGNMQIIDRAENLKKYHRIKGHPKGMLGKFGKDNPTSKAVEGLINGKWVRFAGAREAERETGVDRSHISSVCNGKPDKKGWVRKTAGKDKNGNRIRWRFIN